MEEAYLEWREWVVLVVSVVVSEGGKAVRRLEAVPLFVKGRRVVDSKSFHRNQSARPTNAITSYPQPTTLLFPHSLLPLMGKQPVDLSGTCSVSHGRKAMEGRMYLGDS